MAAPDVWGPTLYIARGPAKKALTVTISTLYRWSCAPPDVGNGSPRSQHRTFKLRHFVPGHGFQSQTWGSIRALACGSGLAGASKDEWRFLASSTVYGLAW